jgi:sporulation protein YlmC with PRC-barrel domain
MTEVRRTHIPRSEAASSAPVPREPTITAARERRVSGLIPARELRGFRLGDARVDVRGWDVLTADGAVVGTIDRLLVDAKTRKVCYLAITPRDGQRRVAKRARRGRVLVPVGVARRVDGCRRVALDVLTAARLENAPRIGDRPVTRADEEAALATFGQSAPATGPGGDRYRGTSFDGTRLFGTPHGEV